MNHNLLQKRIYAQGARLVFDKAYLNAELADTYFDQIFSETSWQQHRIQCFGRDLEIPRLTAWYGDKNTTYRYSGIDLSPRPWTPLLRSIKESLEAISGARFNSVLLNRYRNGKDSVGWHADDEKDLGDTPVIASLSLGATRRFQMKHRYQNGEKLVLDLTHGSLLVMSGNTQNNWLHQIPKTARPVGERINLTFRFIYS